VDGNALVAGLSSAQALEERRAGCGRRFAFLNVRAKKSIPAVGN